MMAETRSVFSTSGAVAVAAVLIFATMGQYAFGDNVQNDVTIGGTDTITAGESTTINYRIIGNNAPSGDISGCNVDSTNKAILTINTPAQVDASVSSVEIEQCGPSGSKAVQFSSSTAGDYPISVTISGGKTGSLWNNQADFTLHVLAAPVTDSTAPEITYALTPSSPDGSNGWYKSDVSVQWTVMDPESDITNTSGCDDSTINYDTDTSGVTLTCEATSAGGTSSESVTIMRDATAPSVSLFGGPADDSSHYFGFVPEAPTCDASDPTPGSGLDGSCSIAGYSNTVGSHTVTASASDIAGNTGYDSRSYTVNAWTLNGFFKPVDMDGVFNVIKGGQTVPLKFQIFAGSTQLTDTSYVDSLKYKKIACPAAGFTSIEGDALATGGTELRYDADAGQFVYNWKTPTNKGTCWEVTLTTDDGSTLAAKFQTR
jgi:hypothetical protein